MVLQSFLSTLTGLQLTSIRFTTHMWFHSQMEAPISLQRAVKHTQTGLQTSLIKLTRMTYATDYLKNTDLPGVVTGIPAKTTSTSKKQSNTGNISHSKETYAVRQVWSVFSDTTKKVCLLNGNTPFI